MAVALTDDGRAAKRAYKKAWQDTHRQHIKDYNARYWNAKGEELKAAADRLKNIKK